MFKQTNVGYDRTEKALVEISYLTKREGMIPRYDSTTIRVLLPRTNEAKVLYISIKDMAKLDIVVFWDLIEKHIQRGVHFRLFFGNFTLNIYPKSSEDRTFNIHLKHVSSLPLPEIQDFVKGEVIKYTNCDGRIDLLMAGNRKDHIITMTAGGISVD